MAYSTDLSDQEWSLIQHLFHRIHPSGKKDTHTKRSMVNAILYLNKTGCQWRFLPKEFAPWQSVYAMYRQWCKRGVWEQALDLLNSHYRKKKAGQKSPALPSLTHKA